MQIAFIQVCEIYCPKVILQRQQKNMAGGNLFREFVGVSLTLVNVITLVDVLFFIVEFVVWF
jgi:hypothetical protein